MSRPKTRFTDIQELNNLNQYDIYMPTRQEYKCQLLPCIESSTSTSLCSLQEIAYSTENTLHVPCIAWQNALFKRTVVYYLKWSS